MRCAVNYIAEVNSFERWLETHHLPATSQLLWYKLFALFNRCGWAEWVTVDNQRLMSLTQCESLNTFLRARTQLIKAGLIKFQRGKKGSPSRYKYISFDSKNELQMEPYTEPKAEPFAELQTEHINKLNKTKPNKEVIGSNNKTPKPPYQEFRQYAGDDKDMLDALLGFAEMRRAIKKPLTARAEKLTLSSLDKLSSDRDEKIAILNKSTMHNWQGVFPLRDDGEKTEGKKGWREL